MAPTATRDHRPSGNPAAPRPGRSRIGAIFRHDVLASLVVFLVAVPLSLGIALASGAPIAAGLIAAIVGGVVAGATGGSPFQVSGPAAGLTVIMAETIDQFGWGVTCLITVIAGAVQIALGMSRVATAALAISPAIVHGMLAGIGVTIVLSQLHVVLGGSPQSSALANITDLPGQLIGHHDTAVMLGVGTIAILLLWPRVPPALRHVPGPLVAVAVVTLVAVVTSADVSRVDLGDEVLTIGLVPELPEGNWAAVLMAAVTVAVIASVESLLSAVAVDRLHTGPRARLNKELVGQGLANMTSGALGGLPVTGVIVRSSANVRAGARTRASAILHGVWVLLFVALLAGLLEQIPLAVLAGLLVHVGASLIAPDHIRTVRAHGDLSIYVVTLAGVVMLDLLNGVLIGVGLSLLLMLHRRVKSLIHAEDCGDGSWRVSVDGALTALSVPRLSRVLGAVPAECAVTIELVVDYLDHAAFEYLSAWKHGHERTGGQVEVIEVGHEWFGHRSTAPHSETKRRLPFLGLLAPWSYWRKTEQGEAWAADRMGVPRTASRLDTLVIACDDAPVVPNLRPAGEQGGIVTVRTSGNTVPRTRNGASGSTIALIEYAVRVLGVREVVVCGHSGCDAVPGGPDDRTPTLDGVHPTTPADRAALCNVLQQIDHVVRNPVVAAAVGAGRLHVCGMYVDGSRVYRADATGEFALVAGTAARAN